MFFNEKEILRSIKRIIKKLRKQKDIINLVHLHPFVISVFPLLFFVNHNKDQLLQNTKGVVTILVLILIFTSMVLGLNLFLFKNFSKAALAAFVSVIIFFYFGHIETLFDKLLPNFNINLSLIAFSPVRQYINTDIGITKMLYFVFAVVLVATYFRVYRATKIPIYIHKTLMLFSITLVLYNAINILFYRSSLEFDKQMIQTDQVDIDQESIGDYPDIYYIIPDSYARSDILQEVYGYDNSEFMEFLKSKGFYVADKSISNYAHTFLSLASSLNMDYMNEISEEDGVKRQDFSRYYSMISNNKIAVYLKNKGYKIVNFSSDIGPTNNLAVADYNIQKNDLFKIGSFELKMDDFTINYLKTTVIYPLFRINLVEFQRQQVLFVLDNLHGLDYVEGPKFVIAHTIIPHPPYIFNKDGGLPEKADRTMQENTSLNKDLYLDQLIFTNIKLQESISEILLKNDNTVIIIQADHGPSVLLGESFEKNLIPMENIDGVKERMSILNAYYFPGGDYSMLVKDATPVNTFRIILNRYFGEDLELLENKVYISDYSNLYKFWDVTDLIK